MKLLQLVKQNKFPNVVIICIFIFVFTILINVCLLLDSKTSVHGNYAEVQYTCKQINGLGKSHADAIYFADYNSFWELKEYFNWVDVKLVNKHFKLRGDFVRNEIFTEVVYINAIVNAISFSIICFYFIGKFYQHELTFASLVRLVGKIKGEKTNGK